MLNIIKTINQKMLDVEMIVPQYCFEVFWLVAFAGCLFTGHDIIAAFCFICLITHRSF